jgi:dipeptidyl aminopeptidase/acylaminoacyl peptidase
MSGNRKSVTVPILTWILLASRLSAGPIPLEVFAAPEAISDAAISPDGHYLAAVEFRGAHRVVVVQDLSSGTHQPRLVLTDVAGKFDISWCSWATKTRLLCSYYGIGEDGFVMFGVTRLVAVDADGGNQRVLLQNSVQVGGQFQDQIIDWNPGPADTVLIEADESLLDSFAREILAAGGSVSGRTTSGGYPAAFELNVVTGKTRLRVHSQPPVLELLSDFHGNPRIGYGFSSGSTTYQYFVRAPTDAGWRHLLKFEAFAQGDLRLPVAVDPSNTARAYALGNLEGRQALWSIDLTDAEEPQLVYSNPEVDVTGPKFLKNGELLGVSYETDRPHMYYTSSHLQLVLKMLDAALAGTTNRIVDCTLDETLCVVKSSSDVEPGVWSLLQTSPARLVSIGRANPQLDPAQLARIVPISYPARDGTQIPGYLTTPIGAQPGHLPLIIMPHGGPIARDDGSYFFLQQFLVNRGYAVLQMNFRGSSGYGHAWYAAAHQDWGGLTYDDIVDGARWAISSGLADPKRVAIVGWSFGGYAALLGAARNSDLFRCAISIAGISDLSELVTEQGNYLGGAISRERIGTRPEKLKADSPRRHIDASTAPILMLHGDKDVNVNIEQSRSMAKALKALGRPYDLIEFPGADHQIRRFEDRKALLHAVEGFLQSHIGSVGVVTPDP